MDGGTVWNINIDSAINQCRDMGATNEEITLDIVICGGTGLNPTKEEVGNSIENFFGARNIKHYYTDSGSIAPELVSVPGVTMRYFFKEANTGCTLSQLNFNGEDTWCL